jgi:alpha-tubulin suppressor-like RCC1 family protein
MRYWRAVVALIMAPLLACDAEFPNEATATLTIELDPGSSASLAVRDTAILGIQVMDSRGDRISGIEVGWQSSDSSILQLSRLSPEGPLEADTLKAQLGVRLIARQRGQATITAIIDRSGFERAESQTAVTVLESWLSISAGAAHTCAVAADSTAYCWGAGASGALGNGIPLNNPRPSAVLAPGNVKFQSVSAGDDNTCGVIREAVVYCWGSGLNGRLGNGDPATRNQLAPAAVAGGGTFQSAAAGAASCGIAVDFTAVCWGDDNLLQLGFQELPLDQLDSCDGLPCSLTPRVVSSTPNSYSRVDVGGVHTCAISRSSEGQALCWGNATRGGLGAGATTISVTPTPVLGDLEFGLITAGGEHTCGVTMAGGAAYCWGNNNHGQLGDASATDRSVPVLVQGGLGFKAVTAGRQHTCGITLAGAAYCWGQGFPGQLGNGTTTDSPVPGPVSGDVTFASLSAGDSYTCGITTEGAAYCWGSGAFGRLGDGSEENRLAPTRILEPE